MISAFTEYSIIVSLLQDSAHFVSGPSVCYPVQYDISKETDQFLYYPPRRNNRFVEALEIKLLFVLVINGDINGENLCKTLDYFVFLNG